MIRRLYTRNRLLFIICITGFILRVISIYIFVELNDPQMWEFGQIARNLLSGSGYSFIANYNIVPSAYMPPGLPYIYYFFFLIFGDTYISYIFILLFNCILSSLSVIIIYKLTDLLFNNKTISLLAAFYTAFSPVYIYSTLSFNSIIIYHFLIGLIYYYFIILQKENLTKGNKILNHSLMLGLIFGIFLYFRAEGTIFLAIVVIYFFFRKKVKSALIVFAVAIIIISPWTIRNYIVFGKLLPVTTSMGYNFYLGHSREENDIRFLTRIKALNEDTQFEINRSAIGIEEALIYMKEKPDKDIGEIFIKLYSLWIIDAYRDMARNPVYVLTWLFTLLLFIYGCYLLRKHEKVKLDLLFLNIYLIFSTLLVVVFFNIPRYQIQMSFIMVPVSMYGVHHILLKLKFPLNKFQINET
jgi:hypothetical protein